MKNKPVKFYKILFWILLCCIMTGCKSCPQIWWVESPVDDKEYEDCYIICPFLNPTCENYRTDQKTPIRFLVKWYDNYELNPNSNDPDGCDYPIIYMDGVKMSPNLHPSPMVNTAAGSATDANGGYTYKSGSIYVAICDETPVLPKICCNDNKIDAGQCRPRDFGKCCNKCIRPIKEHEFRAVISLREKGTQDYKLYERTIKFKTVAGNKCTWDCIPIHEPPHHPVYPPTTPGDGSDQCCKNESCHNNPDGTPCCYDKCVCKDNKCVDPNSGGGTSGLN